MSIFSSRTTDMLHGSILDKLIFFALPLAMTNVLQQLFNTADVAVLGHFLGRDAMASVGSMTPVVSIFVALFGGIALGTNVVLARDLGARCEEGVVAGARTTMVLAVVLGFVTAALCYPCTRSMCTLLAVPEGIMKDAQIYWQYYCLGLPAISLYNFCAAMLRSMGDTTSPLISLTLASLCNIALNLFFTLCLEGGVEGVALATTLSNWLGCLILVVIVFRRPQFGLRKRQALLKTKELREIVTIGFPAAIQGMVFCVSNVLVQSAINSLGEQVIAGSAAAFTIEINLYCLMSAFAQAATTFVSQNYGARNIRRCLAVTRVTLALTLPLNIAMSLLILWLAPYLLGFFTTDPAVFAMAKLRLWYIILPNVVTIFIDLLSGALRGYGCSMPPAVATVVAICGIRIVWVFTVFRWRPEFDVLLVSYPLSWLATSLLISFVYYRFRKAHLVRSLR